ncbi:nitrous oxidase accessory protein [Thermoplasmatales archaeon SCGC AB-540-F20]|nr:nitrous oxidase accessory protein [Thermoplasmatales archaeon SCGC AB-540-F20]
MQNKLWKKGLVLGIIMLLVGTSVVQSTVWVEESTNGRSILYVGGSGPGNYSTIQEAIDDANSGDTVFVYNGTYYENVDITKDGINLIGENKNITIIDAGNGSGILIKNHDYVNVSNFTIRNAKYNTSAGQGWFAFTGNGVSIWSFVYLGGDETASYNVISNCIIQSNDGQGIMIASSETGQISDYNKIEGCEIHDNGYIAQQMGKISSGVCIFPDRDGGSGWAYTRNNEVKNCSIHNNAEVGIYLGREGEASNNLVFRCEIFENSEYGIQIIGADSGGAITSNNYIYENNIYGNQEYGIYIRSPDGSNCNNNYIFHNNILNNTNNSYDEHTNFWDNGYPSGGNYWDDYTGIDADGDGIGDTPHNIPGGSNQDLHPLMYPFKLYYILNISASSEIEEGFSFNVTVKSMAGLTIPNATVEFNDELKLTDSDGRVCFTAPQVGADTYYDITATKNGYTGDIKTILVKDVPVEFVSTFMFGRITNLNTTGEHITFEAVNVRAITLSPFSFIPHTSGELITILKDYTGLLGALFGVQFIFATCDASIG